MRDFRDLQELDYDLSQSETLSDPESLPGYGESEYVEPNTEILIGDGLTIQQWLDKEGV